MSDQQRSGTSRSRKENIVQQEKNPKKPLTTLDRIQAMERQRAERRQQMDERKNEKKLQEEKNAELGVVGDIDFVRMIQDWRAKQPEAAKHEHFDCDAGGRAKGKELCICVRKRPLGKREIEKNDHDAVSCTNPAVIVHDCKHRVDGITKYLNNATFVFDHAFSENINTDTIYECVVLPLVRFVKQRAGRATVFAYGQTGSGKTYTMLGIQERAARDLFDALPTSTAIHISFFEIYGGRCLDLLQDRARLQVREDGKGEVNVVGLSAERVHDPEELLAAIDRGNKIRTTQRTEANDTSSRSHAVCQICLSSSDDDNSDLGKLSLVDLAGSERGADTRSHSRQLRTESAAINKSLLALKECIRGLATNDHHVPFRASKLTMVLRDSFVRSHCRVAMIATVSPAVSATDHTINTLRYADRVKEKPAVGALNAVLKREDSSPPLPSTPETHSTAAEPKPSARRYRNSPPLKKNGIDNSEPKLSSAARRPGSHEKPPRALPSNNTKSPIKRSVSMSEQRNKDEARSTSRRRWSGSEHTPLGTKNTPRLTPEAKPSPQRATPQDSKEEEPEDDDHDLALLQKTIEANGGDSDLQPNLELYRTVDSLFEEEEALLNAHMNMIQENAELLTEEGKMLQSVQIAEDYNIDDYVARLDTILTTKSEQIANLKHRLQRFAQRLKDEENQSRLVRRMPMF